MHRDYVAKVCAGNGNPCKFDTEKTSFSFLIWSIMSAEPINNKRAQVFWYLNLALGATNLPTKETLIRSGQQMRSYVRDSWAKVYHIEQDPSERAGWSDLEPHWHCTSTFGGLSWTPQDCQLPPRSRGMWASPIRRRIRKARHTPSSKNCLNCPSCKCWYLIGVLLLRYQATKRAWCLKICQRRCAMTWPPCQLRLTITISAWQLK